MAEGYEQTLAKVAEQHRAILEQHERWLAEAASTAVQALREENRCLQRELAALKTFFGTQYMGKRPPVPQLPLAWNVDESCGRDDVQTAPAIIVQGARTGIAEACSPSPWAQPPQPPLEPEKSLSKKKHYPHRSKSCPQRSAAATVVGGEPTNKIQASTGTPSSAAFESERSLPGMVAPQVWEEADIENPKARSTSKSFTKLQGQFRRGVTSAIGITKDFSFRDNKMEVRELRRLRMMFGLGSRAFEAEMDEVERCVSKRLKTDSSDWFRKALEELDRSRGKLWEKCPDRLEDLKDSWISADSMVSLEGLVHLQGPLVDELLECVDVELKVAARQIIDAINMTTLDEVLIEATKTTHGKDKTIGSIVSGGKDWYEFTLNTVVVVMVILNVMAFGASIDNSPEHSGWFILEATCCGVFVIEALLKMHWYGLKEYFTGAAVFWNLSDLAITFISLTELCFSIYLIISDDDAVRSGSRVSSAARVAVIMRALRVARVFRLMKLLHSPLLRDLANMLVGFIIGIPSLAWVMIFFLFVLYLLGIVFRMMLGPTGGQDLIGSGCGYGDSYDDFFEPDCQVHHLYGEEFFGSISKSMFTAFRFMLGDYSTRGGKSLVVAFSAGYGIPFDVVFVSFMILVIFGLFNIITAIFVDSTISGLKHNDIKRKYARQYEADFVRSKLKVLMDRVWELHAKRSISLHLPKADSDLYSEENLSCPEDMSSFFLEEEEFVNIMEDGQVRDILSDLDIAMYNPSSMFDSFDPDCDGRVTVIEFIQAIMKLRGEPQKNDIIACFVALRSMQSKLDGISRYLKYAAGGDAAAKSSLSNHGTSGLIRPSLSGPAIGRSASLNLPG